MMVILVDLLVDGGSDVLVVMGADVFLGHRWSRLFLNCSLVLPVFRDEVSDGLLGFLHFDFCLVGL